MKPLDIVSVQIKPFYKDPDQSRQKVSSILSSVDSCDILVLPEMAFPGYSFKDPEDIAPFLEQPNSDFPTFNWCSEQARRLGSYVFCGYPETCEGVLYNSMMVLSPEGTLIANYHKKHLFFVDKTWASEGASFQTVDINIKGNVLKTGLGICMDIDAYEFIDYSKLELGNFLKDSEVDLCVFCTNWTSGGPYKDSEYLVNYWIQRLSPLTNTNKRAFFIAANRVGVEEEIKYMGNSCIIELDNGQSVIRARMNSEEEGFLNYAVQDYLA